MKRSPPPPEDSKVDYTRVLDPPNQYKNAQGFKVIDELIA
jgi:hypothetical protein